MTPPGEIVVDLDAIRHNLLRIRELVGEDCQQMMVVKADGYGHGMVQVSAAAREVGTEWLGVASAHEALALRAAGDSGRILCWLAPSQDFAALLAADVDISISSIDALAVAPAGARVHLKVDTGLSRGGVSRADWHDLFALAAGSDVEVVGIWSHLACSDQPDHPANAAQMRAYAEALTLAEAAGLEPQLRHLANSAGALHHPDSRYDLVRLGIAAYGLAPAPQVATAADLRLVPAMSVTSSLAQTKQIHPGDGVSYGHRYVAAAREQVGLVPLGYGDGIPRHASNVAEVWIDGRREPVRGTICMDQFVVAAPGAHAGDPVLLFGSGSQGEPTAQDWAEACGTISYEIVTRIGGRAARRWLGEAQ